MAEGELPTNGPENPRSQTIPQLSEQVRDEILSRLLLDEFETNAASKVNLFSIEVLSVLSGMGEKGRSSLVALQNALNNPNGSRHTYANSRASGLSFVLAAFDLQTDGALLQSFADPEKAKLFAESLRITLNKESDNPIDSLIHNPPIDETEQPFFVDLLRHLGKESKTFRNDSPVYQAISATYNTLSTMWPLLGIDSTPPSATPPSSDPTPPPPGV